MEEFPGINTGGRRRRRPVRSVVLICPHCDQDVECNFSAEEQSVRCHHCERLFRVPVSAFDAPAPSPAPVFVPEPSPSIDPLPSPKSIPSGFNIDTGSRPASQHPQSQPYRRQPHSATGPRVVKAAIIGGGITAGIAAFAGVVSSQYFPVFGHILLKTWAVPWSQARLDGIPIHLFAFGTVGLVVGALGSAAIAYLGASSQR